MSSVQASYSIADTVQWTPVLQSNVQKCGAEKDQLNKRTKNWWTALAIYDLILAAGVATSWVMGLSTLKIFGFFCAGVVLSLPLMFKCFVVLDALDNSRIKLFYAERHQSCYSDAKFQQWVNDHTEIG